MGYKYINFHPKKQQHLNYVDYRIYTFNMIKKFHKHMPMFAPVFICLVFGVAIVGIFAFVFPQNLPTARAMTFDDCLKAKDSRVLEKYPPVCISADGKQYTKDLPKVKMPQGQ